MVLYLLKPCKHAKNQAFIIDIFYDTAKSSLDFQSSIMWISLKIQKIKGYEN